MDSKITKIEYRLSILIDGKGPQYPFHLFKGSKVEIFASETNYVGIIDDITPGYIILKTEYGCVRPIEAIRIDDIQDISKVPPGYTGLDDRDDGEFESNIGRVYHGF